MKCFFIVIFLLFELVSSRKLLLIQVTFRHGARQPVFLYPYDNSIMTRNPGQLTKEGKNMHYLLGKKLSSKYWKQLFGGTPQETQLNPSKLFVKSTEVLRAIQSAKSQLKGWLQHLSPQKLRKAQNQHSISPGLATNGFLTGPERLIYGQKGSSFHTIPIHIQNQLNPNINQGDFLTLSGIKSCNNLNNWMQAAKSNQNSRRFMQNKDVKETIQALSKTFNIPHIQRDLAFNLYDNYDCFKHMGSPYNAIFQDPKYSETLKFMKQEIYLLRHYDSEMLKRVAGTRYFQATLFNFRNIINDSNSPKLIIYSGHDNSVETILVTLNLTSTQCVYDHFVNKIENQNTCVNTFPVFAAYVVFELYQESQFKYSVRVTYNGQPKILPFCKEEYCPLETIQNYLSNFMVKDLDKQCGNHKINRKQPNIPKIPQAQHTTPKNDKQAQSTTPINEKSAQPTTLKNEKTTTSSAIPIKSQVQPLTPKNPSLTNPTNVQIKNNGSEHSQFIYYIVILILATIIILLLAFLLVKKRQKQIVKNKKYEGYNDLVVQEHHSF